MEDSQKSGVAAVLSIVPGLGHFYRGRFADGLVWFVAVLVGYALFFIPGVVIHLLCIGNAFDRSLTIRRILG